MQSKQKFSIIDLKVVLFFIACLASTGILANSYQLENIWASYKSDKREIPTLLIHPKLKGDYPVVLYIHGRQGLSKDIVNYLNNVASRGVVVVAPDYNFSRAIPTLADFNDLDVEKDINKVVPHLKEITSNLTTLNNKIVILTQGHGGYYALRMSLDKSYNIAGVIGYYPIMQNPNAHKPKHLYGYTTEVDKIDVPTLIMVGDKDSEMRQIHIGRVVKRLKQLNRSVNFIKYDGAGRCFDWDSNSANLLNKTARFDSINQVVRFLKKNVGGNKLLVVGSDGFKFAE